MAINLEGAMSAGLVEGQRLDADKAASALKAYDAAVEKGVSDVMSGAKSSVQVYGGEAAYVEEVARQLQAKGFKARATTGTRGANCLDIEKGTAGTQMNSAPPSHVSHEVVFSWHKDSGQPPPRIQIGDTVIDLAKFAQRPVSGQYRASPAFPADVLASLEQLAAKRGGQYVVGDYQLGVVKQYIWTASGLSAGDFHPSKVAIDVNEQSGSAIQGDGTFSYKLTRPDGAKYSCTLNVATEVKFNAEEVQKARDWYTGR